MKAMEVDLAVVGAGPAGLATALALRRVLPPNTTIALFEARAVESAHGAGVDLLVNGLRALEAIVPCAVHRMYEQGIYKMRFQFYEERTWEFMRESPYDRRKDLDEHQHTSINIGWGRATQILQEALPEGTTVHRGTKLADVRELSPEEQAAAGGFRYTLSLERTAEAGAGATAGAGAAGGERLEVRARWLVGADGYFSRVRRQVGDGVAPEFCDEVIWWANVTAEDLAAAGADWPAALRDMGGLQSVAVGYVPGGASPITMPRFFLALRASVPVIGSRRDNKGAADAEEQGGEAAGLQQDLGVWALQARPEDMAAAGVPFPAPDLAPGEESPALARALATFSFLPDDVRAFLAATKPDQVMERNIHKHPWEKFAPGGWANGRGMVLVGDAAHAPGRPNGQGTNTAFEDAVVLAACVKKHGLGDEAFAAYEAIQQKRVGDIFGASAGLSLAERTALLRGVTFKPLWSPADLPVPVASTEEGLAWSHARVREIVQRRARVDTSAGAEGGGEVGRQAEARKQAVAAA
ncbi:hypothetical protein HYH03_010967 [Edaphochlamys debaryana]|uniref:FAD-binding domain-containing protein n=1 Tax=Edaphochlamys debaryana TaxID=47281 RepID=A0A836BWW4_9CHLO|nr:hypothetical protein HYH03_010967 [Edaphochlamys debaryana]|eukprot:KAG2490573.1 hypothetical protein HYH03_010967 [Edaphochlamys debaryana]